MKIYIRNMVCHRCELAVHAIFKKHGYGSAEVKLGEVTVSGDNVHEKDLDLIDTDLKAIGFEIIREKKRRIIEAIKKHVITEVTAEDSNRKVNLSTRLSKALGYDYNYLSNLFSEVEGTTIEKYFIAQKIEKAKELLVYNELSLSEIAHQLGYSSVAHLSGQFKKTTGLTPSFFRKLKDHKRRRIEEL
jgi:YesN/AraC family two-component response regulator